MRKVLVAGIVAIILAILCLAFIGIFGRVPDEWEWVVIVLAGVGIIMTTPNILQMVWGRACVETIFEVSDEDNERSLVILLKNPPVQNKILKALGVKRETVQSLTAAIRIWKSGIEEPIVPIRHVRLFSDEDISNKGSNRMVLPPTYSVSASMMVATWDNENKGATVLGDRLRKTLLLSGGNYHAKILILVDGEHNEISCQFVVGENRDDLVWVGLKD